MSTAQVEQVMVVPTELFHSCGYFQGFCRETEKYLGKLLDPQQTQYLPRDKMEQDPSFKQLIPYCLFQYTDPQGDVHLFRYTRGKGQGESRLHSKGSVGIGGHISSLDATESSPYLEGMRRELEEEIHITCEYSESCVGLLNDDENEVGKVHLGVVHLIECQQPNITAKETEIADAGFQPVAQIMAEIERYETWSQICLKALFQDNV
ncbi:MAG: phosphoesterase [Planctomycetota bacterium]|jgi:predicted NUDIX family phosphoesterase|nr:phosphoesterase [Planctomycetota bacterium]